MDCYRIMKKRVLSSLLLCVLVACPRPDDDRPPSVAIGQPANDATLTGTTTIQIDAQDSGTGVSKVSLYARGQDSTTKGVLVGTAVSKPYIVSWQPNTALGVPNATPLELVAIARDFAGNEDISSPVRVRTQNPGAPSFNFLTAFTYPPDVQLTSNSSRVKSPGFDVRHLRPPNGISTQKTTIPRPQPQDVANRVFALEWEWSPTAGVDGYCIYSSNADVAGAYTQHRCQNASSGAAKEKFSTLFKDVIPGNQYWGAITTVSSNRTVESGKSNADSATFLPPQDSATPADGSSVTDGRPTLTWTPTTGADGYVYFVFDRNPWEQGAVLKGTNYPRSTAKTSSAWVDGDNQPLPVLPPGTYYWWVSGVSFTGTNADALTFSEPKRFVVP
jgi:Bacterial Ig domain